MTQIKGLDNLNKRLGKLANGAAIAKGLKLASMRVLDTARAECPVDDGALRASLHNEVDALALVATVGTPLEYAPYVEFGTGLYAVKGDGRKTPWRYQDENGDWYTTAGQHPQPFLEDALAQNKAKIKEDIANSVKQEIQK